MTRFARLGLKASNKRTVEEASSWQDMKADIESNEHEKKKSKKAKKAKPDLALADDNADSNGNVDIGKIKSPETSLENSNALKQPKAKKKVKIVVENEASSWQEMKAELIESNEEKSKKADSNEPLDKNKSTKAKKKVKKVVKTDYIIEDGVKYKVFKSGEKKKWIDLHYEENDSMTRYKKFWVKKEDIPELDAFRKSLEEKGLPESQITNQMLHKERKKHNKLRVELMYEQINEQKFKKSQENQTSDMSIPKKVNQHKKEEFQCHTNENESINFEENQMLHKERKKHNKLGMELMYEQINEQKFKKSPENQTSDMSIPKKVNGHEKEEFQCHTNENESINFEENDLMTKFDDFWILRKNLEYLNKTSEMKKENIINERSDGNTDPNLTSDEELIHRRLMKKEKRREHKLLIRKLKKWNKFKIMRNISTKNGSYQSSKSISSTKNGSYQSSKSISSTKNGSHQSSKSPAESNIVKFQGYSVSKEAAERLHQLKEKMEQEGATEEEISNVLKTQRRQEEKHLKREQNNICYKCRGVGHMVDNCPENISEEGSNRLKICYKCGSTEHTSRNCSAGKGDTYTYATCYVCGESGHISRECPDNPRGLYPNDGCCNECGSVEHLKRDCPELQIKSAGNTITLPLYEGQDVEDLEIDISEANDVKATKAKKTKIVKFD